MRSTIGWKKGVERPVLDQTIELHQSHGLIARVGTACMGFRVGQVPRDPKRDVGELHQIVFKNLLLAEQLRSVDERAVGAVQIADKELLIAQIDLGMQSRDGLMRQRQRQAGAPADPKRQRRQRNRPRLAVFVQTAGKAPPVECFQVPEAGMFCCATWSFDLSKCGLASGIGRNRPTISASRGVPQRLKPWYMSPPGPSSAISAKHGTGTGPSQISGCGGFARKCPLRWKWRC